MTPDVSKPTVLDGADSAPDEAAEAAPSDRGTSMTRVMLYSFVVIPFFIAFGAVVFYSVLLFVTADKPDVYKLLGDVRDGYTTKRWQSAYQLALVLRDPASVPDDPQFVSAMLTTFDQAGKERNPEIRQYMALALGRAGKEAFLEPLLTALTKDPAENRPYIIRALGLLRDARAAPALIPYTKDNDARIRLESVIALGDSGNTKAVAPLTKALDDPEPNVCWDAAVALAKLGSNAGKPVLIQLMDRDYLGQFNTLDDAERTRIVLTAIQAATLIKDDDLGAAVQKLARHDPNMTVRKAALAAINNAGTQAKEQNGKSAA